MTQTTSKRNIRPFDAQDQDARAFRARALSGDVTIAPHDGSFIVERDGSAYIVTEQTCSCPDWQYRISQVDGARCKHQCLVGSWLLERGLAFTQPVPESEGTTCCRCHEPMTPSDLEGIPDTGEIVCGICLTADYHDPLASIPPPAGPEDLARPVPAYTQEDALFDRLWGEG